MDKMNMKRKIKWIAWIVLFILICNELGSSLYRISPFSAITVKAAEVEDENVNTGEDSAIEEKSSADISVDETASNSGTISESSTSNQIVQTEIDGVKEETSKEATIEVTTTEATTETTTETTTEESTTEETTTEETTTEEVTTEEVTTEEKSEEIDEVVTVGDYRVFFYADEGVFPADSYVEIKEIKSQRIEKAVEDKITEDEEKEVTDFFAVDITVYDKENHEIQPDTEKGTVRVSFERKKIEKGNSDENKEFQVFHVEDNATKVNEVEVIGDATEKAKEITFEPEHFSVYALVGVKDVDPDATTKTELKITGEIQWNDADIKDYRPAKEGLTVHIYKDAEKTTEITSIKGTDMTVTGAKSDDSWTYDITVKGIPLDDLRNASAYYVDVEVSQYKENSIAKTSKPKSESDAQKFAASADKIVLSIDPATHEDKTFTITWKDGNNAPAQRPAKDAIGSKLDLYVTLQKAGVEQTLKIDSTLAEKFVMSTTPTVTESGNQYTVTYKNLPKKVMVDGEEWDVSAWAIKSNPSLPENYVSENTGDSYTFTWCDDVKAKISWEDEAKPHTSTDEATLLTKFSLYKMEGSTKTQITGNVANLSTDKTYVYYEKMPVYNNAGAKIIYYTQCDDSEIPYHVVYENGTVSTEIDKCYNGCDIKLILDGKIDYTGTVQWWDCENGQTRPNATYTLWRYSKGKEIRAGEVYSESTASIVYKTDAAGNPTRDTISFSLTGEVVTSTNENQRITFSKENHSELGGLAQYDEDGYEYVYFLRQVLDQDTDTASAYYIPYYHDAENAKITEKCIYNGGIVNNVYQRFIDTKLKKTWTNILETSDYDGASVELTLYRTKTGDTDYEKVDEEYWTTKVTLSGFSKQVNSISSDSFKVEKYADDGKAYIYEVKETKVTCGGTTIASTDLSDSYYLLNGRAFQWVADSYDPATVTSPAVLEVKNENVVTSLYSFGKTWSGAYKAKTDGTREASTESSITLNISQSVAGGSTTNYATITVAPVKPAGTEDKQTYTDADGALVHYEDTTKTDIKLPVTCTYHVDNTSGDYWTWEIADTSKLEVPTYDANGKRIEYAVTEGYITNVLTQYSYDISTTLTPDDKANIVNTDVKISNMKIEPGDSVWYKYVTFQKKWVDNGAVSERTAVTYHMIIKNAANQVLYDLANTSDCETFIEAVERSEAYSNTFTEKQKTDLDKVKDSTNNYCVEIKASNNWERNLLKVPIDIETYAAAVSGQTAVVEFGMQKLGGAEIIHSLNADKTAIVDTNKIKTGITLSDKLLCNNGTYAYEETTGKNVDSSVYTVTNTRIGAMDLAVELSWLDIDADTTRPKYVTAKIYQYKESDGTVGAPEITTIKATATPGEYCYDSTVTTDDKATITIDQSVVTGSQYNVKIKDLPKYDATTGERYSYYVELTYHDASESDSNATRIVKYAISDENSYTKHTVNSATEKDQQETVDSGTMTFRYKYVIKEANTEAHFYSLWRDEAQKSGRPDIAYELYYDIIDRDGNIVLKDGNAIAQEKKYTEEVRVADQSLATYAKEREYSGLPMYYYEYEDETETTVKDVYQYKYYAKAIANANLAWYEISVYDKNKSPIKDDAIVYYTDSTNIYNTVTNWTNYSEQILKANYINETKEDGIDTNPIRVNATAQNNDSYIEDGGAVMFRLIGEMNYSGNKIWVLNGNDMLQKENLPYVEIYLWQYKSTATEAEKTAHTHYTTAGELRTHALYYTNLDSATKSEFKFTLSTSYKWNGTNGVEDTNFSIPKYDDLGRNYVYDISEAIYMEHPEAITKDTEPTTMVILPGFIMEPSPAIAGNALSITNTLKNDTGNKREIKIQKTWTNLSHLQTGSYVAAKFLVYQIEAEHVNEDEAAQATSIKNVLTNATKASKCLYKTVYIKGNQTAMSGNTIVETETLSDLPIYSPKGRAYYYVVKEDTSYSPSYQANTSVAQGTDQCSSVTDAPSDGGIYLVYSNGDVASFASNAPVENAHPAVKQANFENAYKDTELAVIKGTIAWEDDSDKYGTREEFVKEHPIRLTITRTAANQSGQTNTATQETIYTAAVTLQDKSASGDTVCHKVQGMTNGTSTDLYIIFTKNGNQWDYTIAGNADGTTGVFDVYNENGNLWKYTIKEEVLSATGATVDASEKNFSKNYTISGNPANSGTYDSTNKVIPIGTIKNSLYHQLKIQKQWSDNINEYTIRPIAVTGYLQVKDQDSWKAYKVADGSLNAINFDSTIGNDYLVTLKADGNTDSDPATGVWNYEYGISKKLPYGYIDDVTTSSTYGKMIPYQYRFVETSLTIKKTDGSVTTAKVKYNRTDAGTDTSPKTGVTKVDSGFYVGGAGSYTATVPVEFSIGGTAGTETKSSQFIYNTLSTENTVSMQIKKVWADEMQGTINAVTAYDVRPNTLYFSIERQITGGSWEKLSKGDGNPLVLSVTKDDAAPTGEWIKTYANLPKLDAEGNEYIYRAVEVANIDGVSLPSSASKNYISSYEASAPDLDNGVTTITNTYVPSKRSLKVSKIWADENNRDEKRPDAITLGLYYYDYKTAAWLPMKKQGDSGLVDVTITLGKNTDDTYTWDYTFENLPCYYKEVVLESGVAKLKNMQYAVKELTVPTNYTATYGDNKSDYNDASVIITADATDTTTKEIKITNTYEPVKKTVRIGKKWSGDQGTISSRPTTPVLVQFYRTYTKDSVTKYEICKKSGAIYSWDAKDSLPAGTETTYQISIANTNQEKSDSSLTENDIWYIDIPNLPCNINAIGDGNVKGTSYQYTYYVKEVADVTGYRMVEGNTGENGLESGTLTGDETTIPILVENHINKTNVSVKANWDDENNRFAKRSDVKVALQRIMDGEGDWSFVTNAGIKLDSFGATAWTKDLTSDADPTKNYTTSFDGVPLYSGTGQKYEYRVVMIDNSGNIITADSDYMSADKQAGLTNKQDGYRGAYDVTSGTTYDETASAAYTTTLNLKLPLVPITGTILWEDTSNMYLERPDAGHFTFNLYSDGTVVNTTNFPNGYNNVILNMHVPASGNAWTYDFTDTVPLYNDSHNFITYTVAETVPTEYVAEAEGKTQQTAGTHFEVADANNHNYATYEMKTIINAMKGAELAVQKKVVTGDNNKQFTFHLSLYDTTVSEYKPFDGSYEKIAKNGSVTLETITDGTILLRDGERFRLARLKEGTKYLVTEDEVSGYTTTIEGETEGEIQDTAVLIQFTNKGNLREYYENSLSSHHSTPVTTVINATILPIGKNIWDQILPGETVDSNRNPNITDNDALSKDAYKNPATGDDRQPLLWLFLAIVSGFSMMCLWLYGKKKQNK